MKDHLHNEINLDDLPDSQPWFFYKEFDFGAGVPILYFYETLSQGFSYSLNQVSAKWTTKGTVNPLKNAGTPLIEFVSTMSGREDQNFPTPLNFIASPGGSGDIGTVSELAAQPLKNRLYLNKFYQYRETIGLKITRTINSEPQKVQLLLTGYLVADEELEQWQR